MLLRVPRRTAGSRQVTLTGGRGRLDISGGSVGSFNELLRELNGGDHRNDVIARGSGRSVSEALDVEVNGRWAFTVRVVR